MATDIALAFMGRFNTVLKRKTKGSVSQAARFLRKLELHGRSYSSCLELLKSTLKHSIATLPTIHANDALRRQRDYIKETFHLIKNELQYQRGKSRPDEISFSKGRYRYGVEANIDGSVRNGKAAAAFYLRAGGKELAQGVCTVDSKNSAEAETEALLMAMRTALSLGHKSLRVLTDTEMLVSLMNGGSKLTHHPLGVQAHQLLNEFTSLELTVVPRMYNHKADCLALVATAL